MNERRHMVGNGEGLLLFVQVIPISVMVTFWIVSSILLK